MTFVWVPTTSAAQTTPYKYTFHGRLTDKAGNVLADGLYNMKFRLMTAATSGTNLWQADRIYTGSGTGDHRVQVTNGRFSVQLGDTSTGVGDPVLSPSLFNTQTNATVYVEIELPTPSTATCAAVSCANFSEQPMTPRQLVSATGSAMNADALDGIDGAALSQLTANQTFTGNNTFTGTFLQQNTSSTAFQVQNAGGTNALLVDTNNLAVKIGGGDVSPSSSPTLLVLDYKNTSGDPTGTNGSMYYNAASSKFRCYEGGVWKDCISAARKRFDVAYDFLRGSAPALANAMNVLDGALYTRLNNGSFSRIAGEVNHPGIIQFNTTSNSAGQASLASTSDTTHGILFGDGAWTNTAIIRIPTASNGTDRFTVYTGLFDGAFALSPANGCFFRYIDNNPTSSGIAVGDRWQPACRNASTESTCLLTNDGTTSGTQPGTVATLGATQWYNLQVAVNATATQALFVLDTGSTIYTCSITTNIPTSNPVSIGMGIIKSGGTTSRTADFDFTETIGEGLSR